MSIYKDIWFCRWCGHIYKPLEETYRDGFCQPACKQAHHRAYNRYVTRRRRSKKQLPRRVTHKRTK